MTFNNISCVHDVTVKVHPLDPCCIPLSEKCILDGVKVEHDFPQEPSTIICVGTFDSPKTTGVSLLSSEEKERQTSDALQSFVFSSLHHSSAEEKAFVAKHLIRRGWRATKGAHVIIPLERSEKWTDCGFFCLGPNGDLTTSDTSNLGLSCGRLIRSTKFEGCTIDFGEEIEERLIERFLVGFYQGMGSDLAAPYKSELFSQLKIRKLNLVARNISLQSASNRACMEAWGCRYASELVMAPANYCTIPNFANSTRQLCESLGLEYKELTEDELVRRKMGAYLAVNKGSAYPPTLMHVTYTPKETPNKHLVFVGKGLTFDSGGYNAKSAQSKIELMKIDMGGAAAVIGAAASIALLKPAGIKVSFISALAENMIDANAYRPGDIVTASNGKTIEVVNTDAEGRLTLADALVYAESLSPDLIVDLATLTGAGIIALGNSIAAFYSPNQKVANYLTQCSERSGDSLWHMPLPAEYHCLIESKVADLKNVGPPAGGSITAALFLKDFVDHTPWAHIDLAGPVFIEGDGLATGFGVKVICQIVQDFAKADI